VSPRASRREQADRARKTTFRPGVGSEKTPAGTPNPIDMIKRSVAGKPLIT